MEKEKNMSCVECDRPSVRLSLFDTLEKVKIQIEYECFYNTRMSYIDKQVSEVCLIIAEILIMNPEHEIRIGGNMIRVSIVQEVFRTLRHSHVGLVIDNFNSITDKIYNKKSYIGTALYNSIFELDTHYKNQVKHDFGY